MSGGSVYGQADPQGWAQYQQYNPYAANDTASTQYSFFPGDTNPGYLDFPTWQNLYSQGMLNGSQTQQQQAPGAITSNMNNTMVDANGNPNFLGAGLNPQYYGNYMANLPADMPGGGGGVIDNYGAAPWVTNWNTGSQILNGAQPGGNAWQQGGQGYYQPYQMISGGGGYNIPGIGTGPFAYSNPYTQAAQGSNLNISDAFNNARYDQYNQLTSANPGSPGRGTMIGGKEYNFAAPWQDSSTGSPFQNTEQAQGNSAGWQSSDTGPTSNQFTPNSFQLEGGASVTGNTQPAQQTGTPWTRDLARKFRAFDRRFARDPGRYTTGYMDRRLQRWDQKNPGFADMWDQYGDWYQQNRNMLTNPFMRSRGLSSENPLMMGGNVSEYFQSLQPTSYQTIWDHRRPDLYRRGF